MKTVKPYWVLILALLAVSPVLNRAAAGETGTAGGEKFSLNDGPHVFWRDDTTAVVFYYWRGELEERTLTAADTLAFQGFAWDSAAAYSIPAAAPSPQPMEFAGVDSLLAVSDIHGDYGPFREILVNSGVMDSSGGWTWGEGHLVMNGDVFDRGPEVTECLWLIHQLQQQAERAGGRVHYLIGNHELMVLRGDDRYVHERYLEGIAGPTRLNYEDLFGPDTELGRWLRSLPSAVRIDGTLFVHGGIPPSEVLEYLTIPEMNSQTAACLDLSTVSMRFDEEARALFGGLGPFWYRGYHYGMEDYYPRATAEQVDDILDFYGAQRIVVGHSEVDSIESLYDGRVIAIDVPVDELGGLQALLWKDGIPYRVNPDGSRRPL